MNSHIYDIEVFRDDWIVVFKNIISGVYTVIHNDNYHLRSFLEQPDIVLGGFNNKHYDDYILLTMIAGGSNVEVKKHNDYIIGGGQPWSFPFIAGQRKRFKTFDLRDDIADQGISLKAIEGNLKLPIVESSVPFDIDRPLTPEELDEVIRYCKNDVDATERLYYERKEDYLDAKVMVGQMYGVSPEEAIGMTNAKLSARVLEATYVERNDEREYVIPDNIDTSLIPEVVLNFFDQIHDKSISNEKLFGSKGSKGMSLDIILKTARDEVLITYSWGGIHGGKFCVTVEETDERALENQDVGSLYPNSMINFGFCSRSMKDPDAYVKLVHKRLGFKHVGDKVQANALKLVVNTVFGAMLNLYNALADRLMGRSVCITNQLAMTVLIVQLAQACESIDFVNINTDGIMYTIDKTEVELADMIVAAWCEITGFEMEKDKFVKVIQKDVNNYIGIKPDGSIKSKGGYVSLWEGGNFKTNSLQIIHKAIVEYLVHGVELEDTIRGCEDIFAFQQIVKTGGSYEGSYHYINGERVPIQKVNRIYAVHDPKYGQVVKGKLITEKRRKDKNTGKMVNIPVDPPVWQESVIPECPEHAFCDNENVLTVSDLDLSYYIDIAKKRIDKYIHVDRKIINRLNKVKEVIEIMAAAKTKPADPAALNIYQKLAFARNQFIEAPVKKSGINRFAEYKYFELSDIVPVALSIFHNLGLVFNISFTAKEAIGTLVNTDNPEETIVFTSPMKDLEVKGMNAVQALGSTETYQRRYLYMVCLDIVEADAFDATNGKPDASGESEAPKKSNRPATAEERENTKKDLIDKDGTATDVQIKSIKNGLKKLREKNPEAHESYVTECVKKIKAGLNKSEAEKMLLEIGEKIAG